MESSAISAAGNCGLGESDGVCVALRSRKLFSASMSPGIDSNAASLSSPETSVVVPITSCVIAVASPDEEGVAAPAIPVMEKLANVGIINGEPSAAGSRLATGKTCGLTPCNVG